MVAGFQKDNMQQENLKNNAKNIITRGYMPTTTKNIIAFSVISVITLGAHSLGYMQAQSDCKHANKLIDHSVNERLLHAAEALM
jgi:hypothetical protein